MTKHINTILSKKLQQRAENGLLRQLTFSEELIDFCSNDYLGFSRENILSDPYSKEKAMLPSGSSGSRLLSGNSPYVETLEQKIADFHHAEAGLLFNSGYDANLGLFSCVPQKGDTILFDEFCHASIRDGIRLSSAISFKFKHNSITDLERLLLKSTGNVFIAIESIYSMDGDIAPFEELVKLSEKYRANLIVDEAHAAGVFGEKGKGLVNEFNIENKVFARVHTFGKALGCHGAVILGSKILRDYLINYCRPFIYTTALPQHSLKFIELAYIALENKHENLGHLKNIITYFQTLANDLALSFVSNNNGPIQWIKTPGNDLVKEIANKLIVKGFDVRPILSPTVPKGEERIRVCLHAYNTKKELEDLL